ncbi:MAG: transposase [Phycisphaerales bacterium]|nr:transposase [Planctomycetota bacterium]
MALPLDKPKPHRKKLHRREHGTRFITFSCFRRLPLLGKAGARNIFVESLYEAREQFGFALYAWVIMPEHVHILMHTRSKAPMATILKSIKLKTSIRILTRWKELRAPILLKILGPTGSPRFWQPGGGFDRNVRDNDEFMRELRYVHRNPVKRGLVEKPEWWEWSSCRWWMGIRGPGIRPCDPPPLFPDELAALMASNSYM